VAVIDLDTGVFPVGRVGLYRGLRRVQRRLAFVLIIALVVGGLSLTARPAQATFPGGIGMIAFASDLDTGGTREIYVRDFGGSTPLRVTTNSAEDFEPQWSPDGTKLVREPWPSECLACGNEVSPRLDGIKNRGQGACIFCATSGYKPDEPGSVYLVTHGGFSAIKVGVRNLDSYRLQEHERYGWTLIEEWQFDNGAVPLRIESAVLDWWRGDLDASVPFTPSDLPQGGYTETASTTEASPEATRDYIARTVAPLSG
jgi:hypothetical protein